MSPTPQETQLRTTVLEALQTIAPELDVGALRDTELLRHQVDLDSYDWLNFLLEVHHRLGVDIPEGDYARLATLEQIVAYLVERLR